tara:strand:+ start:585 stop:830 length:246 start_codon:yes stop_codon:yes gene_type:complete
MRVKEIGVKHQFSIKMKIYKKNNIINQWDDIISKDEWKKLYNEVRKEVIEDIIKEKYVDLIINGEEEIDKKLKKVISDDLS